MLERINMQYKLSSSARLKHNEAGANYYLFCIQSGRHIKINYMSYNILIHLQNGKSPDEIAALICEEYGVTHKASKKDIDDFLKFLSKNNFLTT
jgi:hypothetical protein